MSMPHPRVLMIPWGCVIIMHTTRSRKRTRRRAATWVEIFLKSEIGTLLPDSPGLSEIATIIDTWDDLPSSDWAPGINPPAVIANSSAPLTSVWRARRLNALSKAATPKDVGATEYTKSMRPDHYYYIVPQGWIPPTKSKKKKK